MSNESLKHKILQSFKLSSLKFIPMLLGILAMLFTTSAYAQWYETEGSAQIRHNDVAAAKQRAIDDAIKQAMLESGAFVSSTQVINDGIMSDNSFNISSNNDLRQYTLLEERKDKGFYYVKIKVFIDNQTRECKGMVYKKNVLPVLFSYDKNQVQHTASGLDNFNYAITHKITQLLHNQNNLITNNFVNIKLGLDPERDMQKNNFKDSIYQLAIDNDAQYILIGVLRDISLHGTTEGWFYKAIGFEEREFNLSLYLYDGLSGELMFKDNYNSNSEWEKPIYNNTNSEQFWESKYGQNVLKILNRSVNEISTSIACVNPVARIIKVNSDKTVFINLGKNHNLKQGMRFYIEHEAKFTDNNGKTRFTRTRAKIPMILTELHSNSALLSPIEYSNGNIQINDLAFIE